MPPDVPQQRQSNQAEQSSEQATSVEPSAKEQNAAVATAQRPQNEASEDTVVAGRDGSSSSTIAVSAGQSTVPWPAVTGAPPGYPGKAASRRPQLKRSLRKASFVCTHAGTPHTLVGPAPPPLYRGFMDKLTAKADELLSGGRTQQGYYTQGQGYSQPSYSQQSYGGQQQPYGGQQQQFGGQQQQQYGGQQQYNGQASGNQSMQGNQYNAPQQYQQPQYNTQFDMGRMNGPSGAPPNYGTAPLPHVHPGQVFSVSR